MSRTSSCRWKGEAAGEADDRLQGCGQLHSDNKVETGRPSRHPCDVISVMISQLITRFLALSVPLPRNHRNPPTLQPMETARPALPRLSIPPTVSAFLVSTSYPLRVLSCAPTHSTCSVGGYCQAPLSGLAGPGVERSGVALAVIDDRTVMQNAPLMQRTILYTAI